MTTASFALLHGAASSDLHLLEYVRRVGLTLTFLGAGAVLAYSGLEVWNAIRGTMVERRKRRTRGR